jgi:hypothetical protein
MPCDFRDSTRDSRVITKNIGYFAKHTFLSNSQFSMFKTKESNLVDRIRSIQRSDRSNKQCANCGEMGPVYICTDFLTFVCTECSGLHRELSHKVKSISMSNWSRDEVEALEVSGGNSRDAGKFLASYDSSLYPRPTSMDRERLKEFIRAKYIEKRWTGSRKAAVTIIDRPEIIPDQPRKVKKGKKKQHVDESDDSLDKCGAQQANSAPVSTVDDDIQSRFSGGFEAMEKLHKTNPARSRELALAIIESLRQQFVNRFPAPEDSPVLQISNVPLVMHQPPQLSNNPFELLTNSPFREAPFTSVGIPAETFASPVTTSSNPFDFLQ